MNLFQKYGIKEVADVVFYTITTIGDEEFYTPVLFLDTLKVSTLEKTAEKVEAKGGKGNKKLITWNFGKEITLNLEDALFSPASMSMIWGGKLDSKLSDYTSAIVKTNLANKYGDLHYSIKAYPSPALTDSEWEVVFEQAQNIGLDSTSGNESPSVYIKDGTNDAFVDENRITLIKKYFQRKWDGFSYGLEIDKTEDNKDNFLSIFNHRSPEKPYSKYSTSTSINYKPLSIVVNEFPSIEVLLANTNKDADGVYTYKGGPQGGVAATSEVEVTYLVGDLDTETWEEITTPPRTGYYYLNLRYTIKDGKVFPDTTPGQKAVSIYSLGDQVVPQAIFSGTGTGVCKDNELFFKTLYGSNVASENPFAPLELTSGKAMPELVIQNIMLQLTSLERIGHIETDIHDLEIIDRMEKCIVKDRKGLTISSAKQKENLFRYYADDKTSSYTIYYDAKTMLPLFRIKDGMIMDNEDEFTIKIGTVYYKWTRTVKYKEDEDDGILGKTLVIDAETFPDAYKIVGETYIRNQKTGKDQRYQFTIFRANVTTDTSVTLEAEGDPTTFSMSVDVLTPPNDIMMECKQYDVEDDPYEGGTRIVPQKSKYTYTPANIEYIEEIANKNEELY